VIAALLGRARRRQVSPQAGFALLVVMTTVAVLGAVVGEFGYNARVELEAAANARDTLRAEYLARSGINLSRLLIKVQTKVIDPLNKMGNGSDIQIIEFAPYLLAAFGGGEDERKSMGELLGFDTSRMQGLGVGRGGSFDVVLGTEDGKINLNCGGGIGAQVAQPVPGGGPPGSGSSPAQNGAPQLGSSPVSLLYSMLFATMFPARYNHVFDSVNPDGQYYTRDDIARAIIDWSDVDEQRYDPVAGAGGSSGNGASEDYKYDALRDPYKARNNYLDTTEEVNLVRGVADELWGDFGSMFTVYGRCQVNIRAVSSENWPITAALVRATAADPADPVLLDDTIVAALSQRLAALMVLPGLINGVQGVASFFGSGGMPELPKGSLIDQNMLAGLIGGTGLPPLKINPNNLTLLARMNVPREVYRIESTGSVKRGGGKKIQVRVRAIWDTQKFNQNTTSGDANDKLGTWVYWRME
jgi:general secretion pathway protein K